MRQFSADFFQDASAEFEAVSKHAQGVLAHLLAGKEFRCRHGKVQANLDFARGERNAEVKIGEQQPPLRMLGGGTRIQKPGARSGGICMEQLQQLLFEVPEVEQRFFGDVESSQGNDVS